MLDLWHVCIHAIVITNNNTNIFWMSENGIKVVKGGHRFTTIKKTSSSHEGGMEKFYIG